MSGVWLGCQVARWDATGEDASDLRSQPDIVSENLIVSADW